MVGPVLPTGADAPHVGAEDQNRYQEENSGNFEPQSVADAREGAEKSREAAGQTAAGASGRLAGFAAGWAGGGDPLSGWKLAARLGLSGEALPGNAAGDAQSNAERAAYGFGSHPCL